jgi:hypothetical protein
MDQWLKRGGLSKQSSTAVLSTGVTDVVSRSQGCTSPSNIGSSRIAGISTKRMYNDCCLSLGFMYAGGEIAPDNLRVLCNKVLTNSSMLPAKLRGHRDVNHPVYRNKWHELVFFNLKLVALTNCQSLMVKRSNTDNENVAAVSYRESCNTVLAGGACACRNLNKICAVEMATFVFGEQTKNKL